MLSNYDRWKMCPDDEVDLDAQLTQEQVDEYLEHQMEMASLD